MIGVQASKIFLESPFKDLALRKIKNNEEKKAWNNWIIQSKSPFIIFPIEKNPVLNLSPKILSKNNIASNKYIRVDITYLFKSDACFFEKTFVNL